MFGTWNVNGKMPESLDGWLRTDQPPDLYAIGYHRLWWHRRRRVGVIAITVF